MKNRKSLIARPLVHACKTGKQGLIFTVRPEMLRRIARAAVFYLCCTFVLSPVYAFTNLDFESANVSNLPPNQSEFVSVTEGLPGWSVYIGTDQLTQVGHNLITLGSPNVSILGPQYNTSLPVLEQALEGEYSAVLQAAGSASVSLAQTGLIPPSAKSLQFEAAFVAHNGDLHVTIEGEERPVIPIGNNLYGSDLSAFAGLEKEIRFTMQDSGGDLLILLDAITFSTQAIPEPSGFTLLIFGVMGVGIWRLTFSKRR